MKRNPLAALFCGTVAALSLASTSAALGTHIYQVPMSGAQEVPVVSPAGTGQGTVILDDVTGIVTVTGNYSGLTSNAILAHIHGPAAPGANAGIIVTLTQSGGTTGTFSGSGTLSPTQVTNLLNGLNYLNVHTTINGGGEIRGQIVNDVPSMTWAWMAALTATAVLGGAFALSRRARVAVLAA